MSHVTFCPFGHRHINTYIHMHTYKYIHTHNFTTKKIRFVHPSGQIDVPLQLPWPQSVSMNPRVRPKKKTNSEKSTSKSTKIPPRGEIKVVTQMSHHHCGPESNQSLVGQGCKSKKNAAYLHAAPLMLARLSEDGSALCQTP